ncbi:unnamed protein product, partial [Symbiodinium pilosum]
MSACESCGHWEAALALMDASHTHGCIGDSVAFGIAIRSCSAGSLWQLALYLLCSGEHELAGDMICCSATISACFDALVLG